MKKIIAISLLVLSTGVHAVSKKQIEQSILENQPTGVIGYLNAHNGIKTQIAGKSVLEYAAQQGSNQVLAALIKNYGSEITPGNYKKAATLAAQAGQVDTLKILMRHVSKKSKESVLIGALQSKTPAQAARVVNLLVKDVGVKVTNSVMKAPKKSNSLSLKSLKVLQANHKKAKDAKKKKSKKKKDK